jgi:hypothetical protein
VFYGIYTKRLKDFKKYRGVKMLEMSGLKTLSIEILTINSEFNLLTILLTYKIISYIK